MKVFVAGATGVLGKRAVRELVAAGHEVTGVARTEEKAALLRSLGATPVKVDLFDAAGVKDAVAGHDVVCNLATHIPSTTKMALPGAWDENNRIRSEASRNLVDAALATGAQRYIQESICFMYGDHGDEWIDEDTPLDVPGLGRSMLDSEAQTRRFTEAGGVGVVLRFGFFYGPDAQHTEDSVRAARNHLAPAFGPSDGYMPTINLDDTGTAVVAALKAPAGAYNVTDETTTRGEQMDALAKAVGVKRLFSLPRVFTKAGPASYMARSERVSNRAFKEATGWEPRYRTTREGWPAVVAQMGPGPKRVGLAARLGLLVLAVTGLQLGLWATFAPQSFYKSYPGGGRHWIDINGPFNEHFIRDFGSLQLALALVTIVAIVIGTRGYVALAAGAWIVWSVPHVLYHYFNLEVFTSTVDEVSNVVLLAGTILIPALVLWAAWRAPASPASP